MYTAKPKGINLRANDRDVADGFLQESINLQWRDDAFRPIPERLSSGITDTANKDKILVHKVSDEDKINVLMFDAGVLYWYGNIENGGYVAKIAPVAITDFPTVTDFSSLSFTILNGLVYFMSYTDEFYYRIQFNENDEEYEVKDMYSWKDLVPKYGLVTASGTLNKGDNDRWLQTRCGIVLYRYTYSLNTGEEVLHSPIFIAPLQSINARNSGIWESGDALENIHGFIYSNNSIPNYLQEVYDENISSINVYASLPYYKNEVLYETSDASGYMIQGVDRDELVGEMQRLAETNFYLIQTLNPVQNPQRIMLYTGQLDSGLDYPALETVSVDISTIAAGAVMPVDDFTYHKLYGIIGASNGRLTVSKPKTIFGVGKTLPLTDSELNSNSKTGFSISTEDGNISAYSYLISLDDIDYIGDITETSYIMSYPDSRAYEIGVSENDEDDFRILKTRANKAHNMSCALTFYNYSFEGSWTIEGDTDPDKVKIEIPNRLSVLYGQYKEEISSPPIIEPVGYISENRLQFSESGEFSVWPAIYSERIGDGKILFAGVNSVDPANTNYIAPLIIGTSDGVYTVNFDVTGENLIQSITQTAKLPAISSENIQIEQNLIYISDKGLIAINNGTPINLTEAFFSDQGNDLVNIDSSYLASDLSFFLGGVANYESILPNYNELTNDFLGGYNIYVLSDIVEYLKDAIFAYDGRRENLWCSNPDQSFSLVLSLKEKQWYMSTYIFKEKVELFSSLGTNKGDIYSRYLTLNKDEGLDILSGEDTETEVDIHLLTRPIKMQSADDFKKVERFISRCTLYRSSEDGYMYFGLWGKQDLNKKKVNIPLASVKDGSEKCFPDDTRQDIPIGSLKGKYKAVTALLGGKVLPDSSISGFEISARKVNNNKLR